MTAPASKALLTEYRGKVDESGLSLAMAVEPLKANLAFPAGWLPRGQGTFGTCALS